MFSIFKKKQKSDIEKPVDKYGIENAAKGFSLIILGKLQNTEIAYQFVLEEIEAASRGNDKAIKFATNSGISANEYIGSMSNSRPEVDGPDGPQQTLIGICSQFISNTDLMVELRTRIVDHIMESFSFGKYESQ